MENRELIQLLESRYPDTLPIKEIDKFELGYLVGQQEVIKFIKQQLKYSQEEQETK